MSQAPAKTRRAGAPRANPYCAFTDDEQRRKALESRDRRLVHVAIVIAVVVAILYGVPPGTLAWLRLLA